MYNDEPKHVRISNRVGSFLRMFVKSRESIIITFTMIPDSHKGNPYMMLNVLMMRIQLFMKISPIIIVMICMIIMDH